MYTSKHICLHAKKMPKRLAGLSYVSFKWGGVFQFLTK